MVQTLVQNLPKTGSVREKLREKGQFWTPGWIARPMVSYALQGSNTLFDPAVGEGAFFKAAKQLANGSVKGLEFYGVELDNFALTRAITSDLTRAELQNVELDNFLFKPLTKKYKAIVANPPYIRHHRLDEATKRYLQAFSTELLGSSIDGRAGLHIYYFLRTLQWLDTDGRLAIILPADVCEGVFAPKLWQWITGKYQLEAVISFERKAAPFPNVDVNALVFFIKNSPPEPNFYWLKCLAPDETSLLDTISSNFTFAPKNIEVHERQISEANVTGFSRPPLLKVENEHTLADFASVMRGIATGDNDYFFLASQQISAFNLPQSCFIRAIGRTREVESDKLTLTNLEDLDKCNRPTYLLNLVGKDANNFPVSIQKYLQTGEEKGLPGKTLIATRKPWFRMEQRKVPPILFAYLGRRNTRFILNTAQVVPLTGFLCVYPHVTDQFAIEKLWRALNHPKTLEKLALVGKSYGSGAIKVEPRALEKLPIPNEVIAELELTPTKNTQLLLPL